VGALRNHFSRKAHDPGGPSTAELQDAIERVGFRHVAFNGNRIVLGRRGMGLTLNGIAQGYATDRVVEIVRSGGIARCLVDMGESRALGDHVDGRPWRIEIADPDDPGRTSATLDVVDKAVATSGPYGFRFDSEGSFNHLLDPRRGGSAHLYKSVTVIASTATAADGLSTAFSFLPQPEIERALAALREGQVRLIAATASTSFWMRATFDVDNDPAATTLQRWRGVPMSVVFVSARPTSATSSCERCSGGCEHGARGRYAKSSKGWRRRSGAEAHDPNPGNICS
jgi:thiamine biosynthesis lipoprotein ApbE